MRADYLHAFLYSCITEYNREISLREQFFRKKHFINKKNPFRYYKVVAPLCDDAVNRIKQQNISKDEWIRTLYSEEINNELL